MTKIKNPKILQKRARKIIPGISQLLGKRPDMYLKDDNWPTYYSKAKGVNVWGLDNKKYYDFTMVGIGTSVLGYSDPSINKVAIKALNASPMNTLKSWGSSSMLYFLKKEAPLIIRGSLSILKIASSWVFNSLSSFLNS